MNRISKTELVAFDAKMDPSAHTHGGRQVKVTKQASMQVNNSKIQKGSKKKRNKKKKKKKKANKPTCRVEQIKNTGSTGRRGKKTQETHDENRTDMGGKQTYQQGFAGTTQGVIN